MNAAAIPLKFQVGARTLWSVRRKLVRVAYGLREVLDAHAPILPVVAGADGFLITSLPAERADGVARGRLTGIVRQRYVRYYVDLTAGFETWWEGLSANTRSTLKRKAKKIGDKRIVAYRGGDGLSEFHALARGVAEKTYQERLMGAGLPDTPEFLAQMLTDAAADRVRAWLMFIDGQPAAYLYCPIRDGVVLYEYVGHDPAYADRSPGAVLMLDAMRDLFAEGGLTAFDFTEGEGQHKRSMASGGVPCIDLLLLRATLFNRALLGALKAFDGAMALSKSAVGKLGLQAMVKGLRRG